jgi:hypothetical protein
MTAETILLLLLMGGCAAFIICIVGVLMETE